MKTPKARYMEYIVDSFDCEAMEIEETATKGEKARKFLELIDERHGKLNPVQNTVDHLQGLGEYIDIEFMNSDILETAREFGLIEQMEDRKAKRTLEQIEDKILDGYWTVMANYIHQLANKK